MLQHPEFRCGETLQVFFPSPPADVGVAAQCPETGAGRVDNDKVECVSERQRRKQIELNHADSIGTSASKRAAQEVNPPVADVACHEESPPLHRRPHRSRLATRRRTRVEHAVSRPRIGEVRDELGRLVLHETPALLERGASQWLPLLDDQCIRREQRRAYADAFCV
jgi:hypothetical protein